MSDFHGAAAGLLKHGHASVKMDADFIASLNAIFASGEDFFKGLREQKIVVAVPEILEGYSSSHSEYSQLPDRPDLCESFLVWHRNMAKDDVVRLSKASQLHQRMSTVFPAYMALANNLLEALHQQVKPSAPALKAGETTYLQLNHYRPADYQRDMLQDPHEDGHLLTILKPTAPGAEVLINGEFTRVAIQPDEMFLMPGSVMTALTGGLVPPLLHRVNNDHSTKVRQSLMLFINPTILAETAPWVKAESNHGVSIRDLTIANSANFGLPSLLSFGENNDQQPQG